MENAIIGVLDDNKFVGNLVKVRHDPVSLLGKLIEADGVEAVAKALSDGTVTGTYDAVPCLDNAIADKVYALNLNKECIECYQYCEAGNYLRPSHHSYWESQIRYWRSIGLSDHGDFCHLEKYFIPMVKQLLKIPELANADGEYHKYGEWELALEAIIEFAKEEQIKIPKQIVEYLRLIDERLLFGLPESLIVDA